MHVGKPLAFYNLTVKIDAGNRIVNHFADALLLDAPDSQTYTVVTRTRDTSVQTVLAHRHF